MSLPEPPGRLLQWVIRDPDRRECLLGDLAEDHERIAGSRGRWAADLWYLWAVVQIAVLCALEAARRRLALAVDGHRGREGGGMNELLRDIRYGFRYWARSPGFTAAAVLTIALGIGATTTIFSVVNALLIQAPPGVRGADRIVTVNGMNEKSGRSVRFSYPAFDEFRKSDIGLESVTALELLFASSMTGTNAEPASVIGMLASSEFFTVMGTRPYIGRFFRLDEDVVGQPTPVVVLSHRYWRRAFGADPGVLGRTLTVNRKALTIIGVAEEGFQGPLAGYDFSFFVPLAMAPEVSDIDLQQWDTNGRLSVFGRIAADGSRQQAQAAITVVGRRLSATHAEHLANISFALVPYSKVFEEVRGPVTLFMGLLLGLSGIILLVASINVGGMLLSRAAARTHEMGVRRSLGAGKGRLIRQLLTESALLFLVGGVAGTILAFWATGVLSSLHLPTPVPMALDVTPNVRVLAFALVLALFTGLAFGLAPALEASRIDVADALKAGGGSRRGARRQRLRRAFVASQVAGSVVLLAVAGMLLRALDRADTIDLGFDPKGLHVLGVDLSHQQYAPDAGQAFFQDLSLRVGGLGGVSSVAMARVLPLGFSAQSSTVEIPGRPQGEGEGYEEADFNAVTPNFFSTLGIRFVAGRPFEALDEAGVREAVINETAARRFWPRESALGKHVLWGEDQLQVVGVVADGKYRTLGEEHRSMIYLPFSGRTYAEAFLIVAFTGGQTQLARDLREAVRALDPGLPLATNEPYEQIVAVSLLPNRVAAKAAGAFGLLGLLLASVGLHGALSFAVAERTREMGIRMAMGADRREVRLRVVTDGMKMVALGLVPGILIAFVASALLKSMLYGLSPADPVTFLVIALILGVSGAFASYLPASRATAIDPMTALRCE